MKKLLPLLLFLCTGISTAQFIDRAPWMQTLEKKSTSQKSATQEYRLEEMSDAFETYWADKDPDVKGSGFKPYKRWENYWKHFVDTRGYLPGGKELWQSYKNKQASSAKSNPVSNWTTIGPLTHGIYPGKLPGQGRVNAVHVDPNDPDTWYVGAPAGGIWKSTDAGQSWESLFDEFPQIGVSGIAVDPRDSNVIYIATGDDDASDSYSVGVFKSLDGGQTWNETGLNPGNTPKFALMNEIALDPANPDIVWVATTFGLFKSVDGGDNWENKLERDVVDFRLKPGDGETVYAVTNFTYHRSENGGDTFTQIGGGLPGSSGRLVVDVSEASPETVYILSVKTASASYAFQGLYRSDDSGLIFTKTANNENIMESNQAWFDLAMEVSPDNAEEVYIGCLNLWQSSNGGDSFTRMNRWYQNNPSYTHADIHTIKFFAGRLFVGSDGGIYSSTNKGATFTDNTAGIAIGQFYRLSVSPTDASKMIGGLQDNGGQVLEDGNWNNYHGGDGMDNAIDPNNDQILYGFTQFGGSLNVSTDSGQSIGYVAPPSDANGQGLSGNWITPLAIGSDGSLYSGFDAVYKLENFEWVQQSDKIGNGNIDDLEVDPTDPNVIYAVEAEWIYRSADGGLNFSAFFKADSEIADLAVNTTDGSMVYIVTSNRVGFPMAAQQDLRGVFRIPVNSEGDAGPGEDITLNLPADQAFFSIVHQGRHTENPIYVGTSLGVYRLDDSLTEWEEYDTNLPNLSVSDLDINLDDATLTASTYGRGVWQSPVPTQKPDTDIRLLQVSPMESTVLCGPLVPSIEVENLGLSPVSEITVSFSVNDGTPQEFTETVSLQSEEVAQINLPQLDLTDIGPARLEVTVTTTGDAYADNNSLTNVYYVNQDGQPGVVNTFEDPATDSLLAYNDNNNEVLWELGEPQGQLLDQASSGTMVYGTNLDGNHPDATKAFLITGCYDLSSLLAPVLQFDMAYDLEPNFDILYVQYSTDEGASWNVLGSSESLPNWYNSDRVQDEEGNGVDDCQNCPGAQWTGSDTEMKTYAYDFQLNAQQGETDLTGETNIMFRFVFHSDPFVNQEGVILDDLTIAGLEDDEDDDNDGVLDINDNCPLVANADQEDTDNDGIGDVCDDDADNDGIPDNEDNCPLIANADQADEDQDGIGDVCDEDSDNDGVLNTLDQCPDTPEGTTVNSEGCPVFTLPPDNFMIRAVGVTCIGKADGMVRIEATEELAYSATLTGVGVSVSDTFAQQKDFMDLPIGSYQLCIMVDGQADYEQCFELNIDQPDALGVDSKMSSLDKKVTLNLKGGERYYIRVNDKEYSTRQSTFTVPLEARENKIVVSTDKACQGIYEETLYLNDKLFVYPNPVTSGHVNILLDELSDSEINVRLYNVNGVQVFSKSFETTEEMLQLNLNDFPQGVYILNLKKDNATQTFKIVKQ